MDENFEEQILTPKQVYKMLGISRSQLYRMEERGELYPSHRIGAVEKNGGMRRYRLSDVLNYLEARQTTTEKNTDIES